MAKTQALMCVVLLLVLVAKHEVQADTPCARQCPNECQKKGNFGFQCYLYCVKHCESKTFGKKDAKLSKEELDDLSHEKEAKISEIEKKLITTPAREFHDHDKMAQVAKATNASANKSEQEKKKQEKETQKQDKKETDDEEEEDRIKKQKKETNED